MSFTLNNNPRYAEDGLLMKKGNRGEIIADWHAREREGSGEYLAHRMCHNEPEIQARGADMVVAYSPGSSGLVEVKSTYNAMRFGLVYELSRIYYSGDGGCIVVPGWSTKSEANLLWWYVPQISRLWTMPMSGYQLGYQEFCWDLAADKSLPDGVRHVRSNNDLPLGQRTKHTVIQYVPLSYFKGFTRTYDVSHIEKALGISTKNR